MDYSLPGMIRLQVPPQHAKPGPPLSPVLGQHQIKVAEFVTEFNRQSAGWTPGVPLGVLVHKQGSKFTLRVAPPAFGLLLRGFPPGGIPRRHLWGVLLFRFGSPTPRQARTLLGTLKSLALRVR